MEVLILMLAICGLAFFGFGLITFLSISLDNDIDTPKERIQDTIALMVIGIGFMVISIGIKVFIPF